MSVGQPVTPQYQFRAILAAVLLVLFAVSCFVGYTLYQSKQRYHAAAENTSRNLALALENALHAHFEEIDLALKRARLEFTSMHEEKRFSPELFSAYLRSLKERLPRARSVRGSDADGMVVYGEDVDPSRPLDLKVREFYKRVLTERELVFGIPVKSRITGQVVFPMIYALTYPDGSFGGTAYVVTNKSRIDELIASLNLGKHGVIALFDRRRHLLHPCPSWTAG